MTIIGATFFIAVALAVYLAILALVVVLSDATLSSIQKIAQSIVSLCLPILGPVTVLFMAHAVTPKLLRWVPWPFRNMVSDREIRRYSSEEDQSSDSYL